MLPQQRSAEIVEAHITWNYTTWLNIVFFGLAVLLVWRFLKTGGLAIAANDEPINAGRSPPPFLKHEDRSRDPYFVPEPRYINVQGFDPFI